MDSTELEIPGSNQVSVGLEIVRLASVISLSTEISQDYSLETECLHTLFASVRLQHRGRGSGPSLCYSQEWEDLWYQQSAKMDQKRIKTSLEWDFKHLQSNAFAHFEFIPLIALFLTYSRFSLHQCNNPQGLWRASCLHWGHVRCRDLFRRELLQKQPVRVRNRRRNRMSHPQRPVLLCVSQVRRAAQPNQKLNVKFIFGRKSCFLYLNCVFVCTLVHLQADAFLQGDSWKVISSVQCNEDGPRPPRSSLRDWTSQREWTGICRIRHLQRGAGQRTQTPSCIYYSQQYEELYFIFSKVTKQFVL